MTRNPFAACLAVLFILTHVTLFGYADDATDMMEAALKSQADAQPSNAQPASETIVATATDITKAPKKTAPDAPVVLEPVKVRDVLTQAEKNEGASAEASDKAAGQAEKNSNKSSALESVATQGQLLVADFNSGDKPNNLGGDFGGWDKDPNDDTQTCRATYASDDVDGDMEGFALRLDYDVDSPSPAYNGFWMKLENLNATAYDTLTFSVRGASKNFTKILKVELKTPDAQSSDYFVSGITAEWQKIQVPLKRFKGIKNWSALSEMILVFDDVNTAPKKGTLLIDQIMFERLEGGMPQKSGSARAAEDAASDKPDTQDVAKQTN